ncbi:MAG: hypothetical protein F6K26_47715 [Moorea sp. SIO2I5]|nr:hypothetical protein [Moorena sp. SIO2I5]
MAIPKTVFGIAKTRREEETIRVHLIVLMQSLMGETTAVAHGGNPQDRAASPRPRCIAFAV